VNHDDVDRWLHHAHRDLVDALDGVTDLDVGLADATLPARGKALVTDLDEVLDLDAGLDAILPDPHEETDDPGSLARYAHRFAGRPARERLVARAWLPLPRLAALRVLLKAADTYGAISSIHDTGLGLADARALCQSLAGELPIAQAATRDLDLITDLDRALDVSLGLALHVGSNRELAQDEVRYLRGVLERILNRRHALGTGRHRAPVDDDAEPVLDRIVDVELFPIRVNVDELVPHVKRDETGLARPIAVDLVMRLAQVLVIVLTHDVQFARHTVVAGSRDSAFTATVATVGHEALGEAIPLLERATTDVTGEDLSDADLSGVPLKGVLWSSGTRWPAHLVDDIRDRSVRLGADLWRVVDRGIRANHTNPVI
jgi:hypothetical protein